MKNRVIAFLAIVMTLTLLTGCSNRISRADYDAALEEKDKAAGQLAQVKADLKAGQDQIVQLQATGGNTGAMQTGPTDLTRVSWNPLTYVDKKFGFKLSYPDTWKITTRGTANVPVEIQYNIGDTVPGSWVGLAFDTAEAQPTKSPLRNMVSGWADYQYITSGETVLADNTPASYVEFIATVTSYLMHIYMVGYVDGDHWVYFSVWTIESVAPWDGNLSRQIAHTLTKASASEIANATTPPTTTTTTATTAATSASVNMKSYTDATNKFTFKYNDAWTATWNSATLLVAFGDATYFDPSVRIYKLPKAAGATLVDVLKSSTFLTAVAGNGPTVIDDGTIAEMTNTLGTKATPVLFHFTWTDGATAQSKAYGLIKGDSWYIMMLTISSGWNLQISSINPDNVFATWQFTQ